MSAIGFTGTLNNAYIVPDSNTGGPTGGNWVNWTVNVNTLKAMGVTGTTMTLSAPSDGFIQATIGGTGAMVLNNSYANINLGQGAGAGAGYTGSVAGTWVIVPAANGAPTNANWNGVTISSSGQYQTATINLGGLYTSSDYGANWTLSTSAPSNTYSNWQGIAMSSTGQYQTATISSNFGTGGIYTNSSYGSGTWTLNTYIPSSTDSYWYKVAMSSSGQYQTAPKQAYTDGATGGLYTNNSYGLGTWTLVLSANFSWYCVAMSSTGQYQTAVAFNGIYTGGLYTSSNYGGTWVLNGSAPANVTSATWVGVAMSSSGQYQTAVTTTSGLYTSNNFGVTWTSNTSYSTYSFFNVVVSSTGQYQIAGGGSGIYTNSNYGLGTWTFFSLYSPYVAMSSLGVYQTAVVYNGGIYKVIPSNNNNNVYIGANTKISDSYGISNEVVIGNGVQGAGPNTVVIGTNSTTLATLTNMGLVCNAGTQTIAVTSTSYNTSTLIATLNYTAGTIIPVAGQWVSVTVSDTRYNGTFVVITATSTSLTVQNYVGVTLSTSTGIITIVGPATQPLTFGDSTFRTTNKAPIITMITTNSAVAGTPMAVANTYTTPIGTSYLRVRMVGAGGGGNNYLNTPNAGIGGYTQFGSYIAYGGQIGINAYSGYWTDTTRPFQSTCQGGLGGGVRQASSSSFTTAQGTVTVDSSVSSFFVSGYVPIAGQTISLNGFSPDSWNGIKTIVSATTSSVTFSASGLSAVTSYGVFVINQPDANTICIPGGQGGNGLYILTGGTAVTGAMGGCSMLGPNAAGLFAGNPAGGLTAQPALPIGSYAFGGGGQGGATVLNNYAGNGGGGGMYIETFISNPATSYYTLVGQGGQGAGGDNNLRYNAAPGFNGVIIVMAYF